jgi:hypothetical protein
VSKRATLLFDSARAGTLVGTRGLAGEERSLLYGAGTIAVDVVVFAARDGLHVIHGQVIDTAGDHPLGGARVRLDDARDAVDTDHFGQFSLSTLVGTPGQALCVEGDGVAFACPLPRLAAPDRRRT